MTPQFDLIGLVVEDMAASLAFYRRLGLEVPDGAETEPHVEHALPGGLRLAWDTVETVRSFDPVWQPPKGSPRMGLAFLCSDPADVDRVYGEQRRPLRRTLTLALAFARAAGYSPGPRPGACFGNGQTVRFVGRPG